MKRMINNQYMLLMDELLNSLQCNLVFRSYLSNTFILNEIRQLKRDVENGTRDEDDVNQTMDALINTIGLLVPPNLGYRPSLDHDKFITTVCEVKKSSLKNLIDRRKN